MHMTSFKQSVIACENEKMWKINDLCKKKVTSKIKEYHVQKNCENMTCENK